MGMCIGAASVSIMLRVFVELAVTHIWGWNDCESIKILLCIMLITVKTCLTGFVSYCLIYPSQQL